MIEESPMISSGARVSLAALSKGRLKRHHFWPSQWLDKVVAQSYQVNRTLALSSRRPGRYKFVLGSSLESGYKEKKLFINQNSPVRYPKGPFHEKDSSLLPAPLSGNSIYSLCKNANPHNTIER